MSRTLRRACTTFRTAIRSDPDSLQSFGAGPQGPALFRPRRRVWRSDAPADCPQPDAAPEPRSVSRGASEEAIGRTAAGWLAARVFWRGCGRRGKRLAATGGGVAGARGEAILRRGGSQAEASRPAALNARQPVPCGFGAASAGLDGAGPKGPAPLLSGRAGDSTHGCPSEAHETARACGPRLGRLPSGSRDPHLGSTPARPANQGDDSAAHRSGSGAAGAVTPRRRPGWAPCGGRPR